jgi:hypothetical protein
VDGAEAAAVGLRWYPGFVTLEAAKSLIKFKKVDKSLGCSKKSCLPGRVIGIALIMTW